VGRQDTAPAARGGVARAAQGTQYPFTQYG
jgi:hypothetical protein